MRKLFFILFFILFLLNLINPPNVVSQDYLPLLFERALMQSREGDFFEALKSWDDFLLLSPEDAVALSNRGNIRLALGDPEGAIIDQTKSIDLQPADPDPHLNRGIAEEALELWDQASIDYEWILERSKSNFIYFN